MTEPMDDEELAEVREELQRSHRIGDTVWGPRQLIERLLARLDAAEAEREAFFYTDALPACTLIMPGFTSGNQCAGSTRPLAILHALLSALIAREQAGGENT